MNDATAPNQTKPPHPLWGLFGALGLLLIVVGASLLLYVGYFVYIVLNSPAEIPLVEYIIEHFKIGDAAFSGVMNIPVIPDQTQTMSFDVKIAESVRLMMFLFIGIITFSVLAKISSVLISSGIVLVKLSGPKD